METILKQVVCIIYTGFTSPFLRSTFPVSTQCYVMLLDNINTWFYNLPEHLVAAGRRIFLLSVQKLSDSNHCSRSGCDDYRPIAFFKSSAQV
jgi:hypothetical protein